MLGAAGTAAFWKIAFSGNSCLLWVRVPERFVRRGVSGRGPRAQERWTWRPWRCWIAWVEYLGDGKELTCCDSSELVAGFVLVRVRANPGN